jgi:hypothetical protein
MTPHCDVPACPHHGQPTLFHTHPRRLRCRPHRRRGPAGRRRRQRAAAVRNLLAGITAAAYARQIETSRTGN